MIEIQVLQVHDNVCFEVRNTENGKKSFVPYDPSEPKSLWNEVTTVVQAYHKKKYYKAMRHIANMELASLLPETVVVVQGELITINSAEKPQQP